MDDNDLRGGWLQTVLALNPAVDPSAVIDAGDDLLQRWAEPHRRYHTAQHLSEMLQSLDELSAATGISAHERQIAVVAAWLHDAVYDVRSAPGDSERASARLARKLLLPLGIGTRDLQLVEQLILLTIDHGTPLPGALADAFTDADLAVLATPASRFDEYCTQVRAEYAHVPDELYAAARSSILRDLVDRPDVYRTSHARTEWTDRARANVAHELSRLGAGLGE